ncbi:MAG: hypothetical protein ACR2I2_23770 [Bryobacteraceae bacterium]
MAQNVDAGTRMMSAEAVRTAIDEAEKDFLKCWETLALMKHGPISPDFGEHFLAFQPRLASALFGLDEVYRRLRKEEKATIANKSQLGSDVVASLLRESDELRTALKSAMDVGRAIGDAFAWFFYRKSQNKVGQQRRHSAIPHTPPGVGGLAEIEFLKHIRYADCVVIYHGITSFLRVGDFSFLDLRSGEVIALGELKARKVGSGRAEVTLHMIGTDPKRIPFNRIPATPGTSEMHHGEAKKDFAERLERQITEMQESLAPNKENSPPNVPESFTKRNSFHEGYEISALQSLSDSLEVADVAYEQVGSGLLLIGLNVLPEASLFDRLFGAKAIDFNARLETVVGRSVKLVHFGSHDNSIRMGEISTGFLPGCAPPFWLPVDLHFLRRLYFQGAIVQTIYNPAHVLERFRKAGFNVIRSEDGLSYQIEKAVQADR